MNDRALVNAVFNGDASYGAPVTAYYHFGQQYQEGSVHADLEVAYYERFRPDILKVMNDYSFPCPDGMARLTSPAFPRAVKSPVIGTAAARQSARHMGYGV